MNDEKDQGNSDECAICGEGGALICCETCPESFHLACLGLNPSDVEGIEKWSCPSCTRKRNLQLSPTKSPGKRPRGGDSPDSGRSSARNEIILISDNNENVVHDRKTTKLHMQ
mmetsp:Transcript_33445/g.80866  ORF Transcript_33445/g.80866 Transcript_33445/m.80866 type:complete len:113 (-) Transcript_33445:195-533(-)